MFVLCGHCDLITKDPASHLDWAQQKARYDQHQNQESDAGYVKFLSQLTEPLLKLAVEKELRILDWGSGPVPVLSRLLKQKGISVEIYDPLYQPILPTGVFSAITCSEVIEHFQDPNPAILEIQKYLQTDGVFAGLTSFHQGKKHFQTWWYPRDPTHVVFYSEKTFRWIGGHLNWSVVELNNPVFIFRKD